MLTAAGVACAKDGKSNLLRIRWPAVGSQHLCAPRYLDAMEKSRVYRGLRKENRVCRLIEFDTGGRGLASFDPDGDVAVTAHA